MAVVIHFKDGCTGRTWFNTADEAFRFVKDYATCIGNQVNDEYEEAEWHCAAGHARTVALSKNRDKVCRFYFPDESYMQVYTDE